MNTPEPIKLLFSIVDHGRGKLVKRFAEDNNIYFSWRLHGEGTASSDLLDMLGLGSAKKDLILSLVPAHRVPVVIQSISNLMSMGSPGRGIAFSVPLAALNALAAREIHDLTEPKKGNNPVKGEDLVSFRLILAVYNAGFTDDVVAAAREAGATGGTIIHSRGIAKDEGETFFGLTIQDEKEVILILSPTELSSPIMDALNKHCGPNTPVKALVMALPVSDVAGLG